MKLTLAMARTIATHERLYYTELGRPVNQALIREGAYVYDKATGWATLAPKALEVRSSLQAFFADLDRLGVTLT